MLSTFDTQTLKNKILIKYNEN